MKPGGPIIAVITRETRMAGLRARWATAKQAAFRLQQAAFHEVELRKKRNNAIAAGKTRSNDADFAIVAGALATNSEYEDEDTIYQKSVSALIDAIDLGLPIKQVDRTFLPNFDFGRCLAIVVIGQDGLVANAAKYVGRIPIVGVNPDPSRYDGVLLPFDVRQARMAIKNVVDGCAKSRDVTLAEVNTNDGQRMLAFNDFYVGTNSHVSARYTLETNGRTESQSSSGVLLTTGAGSTGWFSSLFNMADGFCRQFGSKAIHRVKMNWEEQRLAWAVREPFRSRHSGIELVTGLVEENDELVIGSQMPNGGVIFSDGIESDFLEFGSGTIARFVVSKQKAKLVVAG